MWGSLLVGVLLGLFLRGVGVLESLLLRVVGVLESGRLVEGLLARAERSEFSSVSVRSF